MSSFSSYEKDKKIFDDWRSFLTEQKVQVQTWGELRKLINNIVMRDKLSGVGKEAAKMVVDEIIGKIPGGSGLKKTWDVFKGLYNSPDNKKTNTKLDKLNIDDEYSAIVDDTVEDSFLRVLVAAIEKEPSDQVIPDDWDISNQLEAYISKQYGNRTVSGYEK